MFFYHVMVTQQALIFAQFPDFPGLLAAKSLCLFQSLRCNVRLMVFPFIVLCQTRPFNLVAYCF